MNFANLKKGFNRKDRKKEKYDVQVRNALSDQSLIYSYGKPYNCHQCHIAEIIGEIFRATSMLERIYRDGLSGNA